MRHSLTAVAVALVALTVATGTALGARSDQQQLRTQQTQQSQTAQTAQTSRHKALVYYGGEISRFQKETWHWQRVMGKKLTPAGGRRLAELTPTAIQRAAAQWRHRSAAVHKTAKHPPHLSQFLCIHHYEGSWRDTGAPYFGGLQMDVSFQQAYGRWLYAKKGTANHWSPLEQIWVAENALQSRGFWPWPNTARYCGLL